MILMSYYCGNCGMKIEGAAGFCPSCGQALTGAGAAAPQPYGDIPQGLMLDPQGNIYWHYTRKMIKHPEVLLKFMKIYTVIMILAFACVGIILCVQEEELDPLLDILPILLIILAGSWVLAFLIWLIVCAVRGGKDEMDFVLTDRYIAYVISPKKADKNQRIAQAVQLTGVLTGDVSLMMQGAVAGTHAGGVLSSFSDINLIDIRRKQEMIWVKAGIENNAIYIYPHQFDYILRRLKSKCPKAKIKGE